MTTTPHDRLTRSLEASQQTKNEMVEQHRARYDLVPITEHYRGGELVAVVHACGPREQREVDAPVLSTGMGVLGFRSDEVHVVMEVLARMIPMGDEYRPGELLRSFQHDAGSDVTQGLTALSIHHTERGVRIACATAPYTYTERGGGVLGVTWRDVITPPVAAGDLAAVGRQVRSMLAERWDDGSRTMDEALEEECGVPAASMSAEDRDHATARLIASLYRHAVVVHGTEVSP